MSQQPVQTVSGKLILLIKAGYWLALLIIAAMVIASFILLQQMMATQQHNNTLLDIVSTQKTLSQRIVFLAGATSSGSRDKQPALVSALKQATAEFETNYDLLVTVPLPSTCTVSGKKICSKVAVTSWSPAMNTLQGSAAAATR